LTVRPHRTVLMQMQFDDLKYALRSPFLDRGKPDDTILLIGMGRSGTTWIADIINHDRSCRVLFEPFFPALVPEARGFEYIQYMRPTDDDPALAAAAVRILAGRTRSRWVDRDNPGLFYRRRIIKDIRCNLMAGWLHAIFPRMPIVLVIRHPLQVAASWKKLGWGTEALGRRSDFAIITSQHRLLEDFPAIGTIAGQINPDEFVDNVIFLWGVFHLVPFRHLRQSEFHCLFYEYLLTRPEEECEKLFTYLGKPYSWNEVRDAVARQSSTNFHERDLIVDKKSLLEGWKEEFSAAEINRAYEILALFGLDSMYGADGMPSEQAGLR
jgi:hypothetical protein